MLVMHFKDFDVEAFVEGTCGLFDQSRQQIDAKAHITRLDDCRMARRSLNFSFIIRRKSCRADDMDDTRLCGKRGSGDTRRGCGKIEDALYSRKNFERFARNRHAEVTGARHLARVLPDSWRTWPLDRSCDRACPCLLDGSDKSAPHPARSPHDR